jgi:hypothetical protein
VQWLALGLLALLPLLARSPVGLGLSLVGAVALCVFPARRRVLFDARRQALRVEHAGFLGERGSLEIPFARVEGVVFQPAGRKGGQPLYAAFARTAGGRIYLSTHSGERNTAELERALCAMWEERS